MTEQLYKEVGTLRVLCPELQSEVAVERDAKDSALRDLRKAKSEREKITRDMAVLKQQAKASLAAAKKSTEESAAIQVSADGSMSALQSEVENLKRSLEQVVRQQQQRELAHRGSSEPDGSVKAVQGRLGGVEDQVKTLQAEMGRLQSENESLRRECSAAPARNGSGSNSTPQVLALQRRVRVPISLSASYTLLPWKLEPHFMCQSSHAFDGRLVLLVSPGDDDAAGSKNDGG